MAEKQISPTDQSELKQLAAEGFHMGESSPLGAAESGLSGLNASISGIFGDTKGAVAPPKKEAKQKALPSPTQAVKEQTQSPYEQLANALATQDLTQINQLQSGISDASVTGLTGEAGQASQTQLAQLLGAAGLSPASGASKAAMTPLTQTDPLQGQVNAAQQGVSNAENASAVDYAKAIKDTGVANTQTLEAAPWEQILQELAQETAYKATTAGPSAFGATTADTPAFLSQIYKNLNVGTVPGAIGTGLSAPQAVQKAAKGGTSGAVPGSTGTTGGP